jgi:hypothetical protein
LSKFHRDAWQGIGPYTSVSPGLFFYKRGKLNLAILIFLYLHSSKPQKLDGDKTEWNFLLQMNLKGQPTCIDKTKEVTCYSDYYFASNLLGYLADIYQALPICHTLS